MADPTDADLMASFRASQKPGQQTQPPPSMAYDQQYGIIRNPDGSIYGFPGGVSVKLTGTGADPSLPFVTTPDTNPDRIARFLADHPEDVAHRPAAETPTDADLTASLQQQVPDAIGAPAPAPAQQPYIDPQQHPIQAFGQTANNGLRDILNGATFGGMDRFNAALESLPALAQVPTQGLGALSQAFSQHMDEQKALDANHPGLAHDINGFIGGMVPAALAPEVPASTMLGRAGVAAMQGAFWGGAEGIGNTRGNLSDMLRGGALPAAGAAALGAPLGMALGASTMAAKIPQIASLADYARAKVDPMLAVNGPQSAQRVGQIVKGLPFVGTPLAEAGQRTAQQVNAGVRRVAQSLGGSTTPFEAGGALERGAKRAEASLRARNNALYAPVNQLEASSAQIPAAHAQAAIKGIFDQFQTPAIRERVARNAPQLAAASRDLEAAGGKMTFRELKEMRREIGQMLNDRTHTSGIDQGRLKVLYGAMSEDLKEGARALGGERAVQALRRADQHNAAMMDRIDNVLSTITDAPSREKAFDKVAAMAGSNTRADIRQLQLLMRTLPADARAEFAAGVIQSLGRDAEGGFSTAKFATAWSKMTPEGKHAIIGNVETVKDLDALFRVAQQMKAADKFYNHSNSGHVTAGVLVADKLYEFATEGNLHHMMATAAHDIPAIGALYALSFGAAKALASPGFARLVLRATKAQTPGSQHQIEQAIIRYANDNQPMRAVALQYADLLSRRFKANAPVMAGVDAQRQMRRRAAGQ